MSLESLNCPKCGAPLHFDNPEQEYCFCSHCGQQVYKQDVHFDKRIEIEKMKLNEESKNNKRNFMLKLVKAYFIYIGIAVLVLIILTIISKF